MTPTVLTPTPTAGSDVRRASEETPATESDVLFADFLVPESTPASVVLGEDTPELSIAEAVEKVPETASEQGDDDVEFAAPPLDKRADQALNATQPQAVALKSTDASQQPVLRDTVSVEQGRRLDAPDVPNTVRATNNVVVPGTVAQSVVEGRLPSATALPVPAKAEVTAQQKTLPEPQAPPLQAPQIQNVAASQITQQTALPSNLTDQIVKARGFRDAQETENKQDLRSAMPTTTTPVQTPQTAVAASNTISPNVPAPQVMSHLKLDDPAVAEKSLDADTSFSPRVGERGHLAPQPGVAGATLGTAETARHVGQQLAAVIATSSGKATEIALNPEELGRVRLSMTAVDGAITLNVLAERPETQDLLRRHMDILAQEFRDLGYASISFSFGEQGQPDDQEQQDTAHRNGEAELVNEVGLDRTVQAQMNSGLDLRI